MVLSRQLQPKTLQSMNPPSMPSTRTLSQSCEAKLPRSSQEPEANISGTSFDLSTRLYANGSRHTVDSEAQHVDTWQNSTSTTALRAGTQAMTERTTYANQASSPASSENESDMWTPEKTRKRTRLHIGQSKKRRRVEDFGDQQPIYSPPAKLLTKSGEVHVRVIGDQTRVGTKFDDDDGYYKVMPGDDLTSQYTLMKVLGCGTFGKVVQAFDKRRGKLVAIKMFRSPHRYQKASKVELRVLQTLKDNDEKNIYQCIHLLDCFEFCGHVCIVLDLLGSSIYDFLESNEFVPFPNSQIQSFARQLFTSVAYLHDLGIIHTDLKPENVLLCNNTYQTFTYNRILPSSLTTAPKRVTQRKVLLDSEIRLIDFSSATFQDEHHSRMISTRHYRAPEVILGLGWSFPCDIWSIGCILTELFTGRTLFQTHDDLEHLAMMENVCDVPIDPCLVQKLCGRPNDNLATKYFKDLILNDSTSTTSKEPIKSTKRLSLIVSSTTPPLDLFLDLLKKIFVFDPAKRITAREALEHPWLRKVLPPDDGTQAARIRLQRIQAEIP